MLQPFIPSGPDFDVAKSFFIALGFQIKWEEYVGFRFGDAQFILQGLNNQESQNNLIIQAVVKDLDDWWTHILESGVLETYPGVSAKEPAHYPWGEREIHLIDTAGVAWRFVEAKNPILN